MLTNQTLTFATANLFNFVEPPGAFYDFENIYEREAWQEKCRWTQQQLKQLNGDIVALQEVFSIEAARELMQQLGYPYFVTVDTPDIEQEYIYSKPVVALACKYPIIDTKPVTPLHAISQGYQAQVPSFSRKPICAIVDITNIGQVAVYVCHLKSQRATDSLEPEYEQPLVGRWLSSQQRGWEAVMLRLFMQQQYQTHPMPTVLMGDLNQALSSDITGLLTETIEQHPVALQLQDSWQLISDNKATSQRQATHYHFAKGNVLDYILLSQEFHPGSQHSLADVLDYRTLDKHLINPSFEQDKQASDHAFVAVTVRFVL